MKTRRHLERYRKVEYYSDTNYNILILFTAEYNAIRTFSLAQLICENTEGMELVQRDIFQHKWANLYMWTFEHIHLNSISAIAKWDAAVSNRFRWQELFSEMKTQINHDR